MLNAILYTINFLQPFNVVRIISGGRVLFELFLHYFQGLGVFATADGFVGFGLGFFGGLAWGSVVLLVLFLFLLFEFFELLPHEFVIKFCIGILRIQFQSAAIILERFLPGFGFFGRVG